MQGNKTNEINNKELKETLANTALSILIQGEHYDDLLGLTVEFGYLFDFEGHGIEALFKIITDKGIFYFAAQKDSLMKLDFSEEYFKAHTQTFFEIHG